MEEILYGLIIFYKSICCIMKKILVEVVFTGYVLLTCNITQVYYDHNCYYFYKNL